MGNKALKDIRTALGLSQRETATRANVSKTVVAQVEQERRGLSVASSMKAAPVLDVDPGVLYLGSHLIVLKNKLEDEEISESQAADKLLRIVANLLEKFPDVESAEGGEELLDELETMLSENTSVATKSLRSGDAPVGAFSQQVRLATKSYPVEAYTEDAGDGRGFYGERLSSRSLRDPDEHRFPDPDAEFGSANIAHTYDDDDEEPDLSPRDPFGRAVRPFDGRR